MAQFTNSTFQKHDDYMTPNYAWRNIQKYIPDKKIWEAFYGDGSSGTILKEMGFDTIHENLDFFQNDMGEIVVSNPPFTKIPEILKRLKELNKPFILIMPSSKINTKYFRQIFCNDKDPIQLIVPVRRIKFKKMINGIVDPKVKSCPNFDCFYYCWKIGLDRDIIWLGDQQDTEFMDEDIWKVNNFKKITNKQLKMLQSNLTV